MTSSANSVHYTVLPIDPYAHLFAVSCTLSSTPGQKQRFYMPAWTPGSYKIRDFSKYVSEVRAESAGKPIECHKIDKQTWECAASEEPITLHYRVYAWDLSVRGSHFDQTHATINGASVFVCPENAENAICTVDIQRPEGVQYANWRVATTLSRKDEALYAFGEYQADDYAQLIDHPIELGDFVTTTFTEQGIPHELVFTGLAPNTDLARITADVQRMCAYYLKLFPKPYPMQRYMFLIMLLDQGFGGLEHSDSSYLHFSKYLLPTAHDKMVSEGYMSFLTLCSHEYLHTWLVKAIKPAVFMPYNLHQENHTELLWIFEGFTAYYEDLALVRSGLITQEQYFTLTAQKITRLWRTPGRKVQNVAEASFDAWIKFYQPDENTPNITISYYLKGSLIALILDITLRDLTKNKSSLDTILLNLWAYYGHEQKGVPEKVLYRLLHESVGNQCDDLLNTCLYGTEELPLEQALNKVGVELQQRHACTPNDKGLVITDKNGAPEKPENTPVDLGIVYDLRQTAIMVQSCLVGGAAQQAGISAGDIIVAVDHLRVEAHSLTQHLARYMPGDEITVHVFRRDRLMTFSVILAPALPVAMLVLENAPRKSARDQRLAWLMEK